jgi:hypothetical protein
MRGLRSIISAAGLLVSSVSGLQAQEGFKPGYTDIGPVIGLGGLGRASLAFGGRFEHALKPLPDLSDGVLGFEVSIDWYRYSERFFFDGEDLGGFDFTAIPIGATANYHFSVTNPKIDPFLGLGLGYLSISTDFAGNHGSGLYFIGRAGMRYFYSPRMAFYGDLGAGAALLNVGVTFKIGGA